MGIDTRHAVAPIGGAATAAEDVGNGEVRQFVTLPALFGPFVEATGLQRRKSDL